MPTMPLRTASIGGIDGNCTWERGLGSANTNFASLLRRSELLVVKLCGFADAERVIRRLRAASCDDTLSEVLMAVAQDAMGRFQADKLSDGRYVIRCVQGHSHHVSGQMMNEYAFDR